MSYREENGKDMNQAKPPRMSREDRMFLAGCICALAPLYRFRQDTIYDEIVRACGEGPLIEEARRSGSMRWSGLDNYVRRKKQGL